MKKIYRIEKDNDFNGGIDFNTYEEALENITKQLHDEANYMYNINKDNIYSLCEINVINENEDNYEEEYFDTLISISV
ncbi:MAG TPA: hypothetical protein DCE23_07725, partial [Firmicutes bacterium]|nr:hypothetical protein [Bacillota bacterium]